MLASSTPSRRASSLAICGEEKASAPELMAAAAWPTDSASRNPSTFSLKLEPFRLVAATVFGDADDRISHGARRFRGWLGHWRLAPVPSCMAPARAVFKIHFPGIAVLKAPASDHKDPYNLSERHKVAGWHRVDASSRYGAVCCQLTPNRVPVTRQDPRRLVLGESQAVNAQGRPEAH